MRRIFRVAEAGGAPRALAAMVASVLLASVAPAQTQSGQNARRVVDTQAAAAPAVNASPEKAAAGARQPAAAERANALGVARARAGRLAEAITLFKQAVEDDPDAGVIHYN